MEKEIKIALVIKTEGLEYDDRVRKEILSVKKLFPNISFKIFAMLPENIEKEGVTSYGVPYKAVYIPARDKYPSSKHILQKAYEFHKAIKKDLKEYDAIWCGDRGSFMTVALTRNKYLLWDLHELPLEFMGGFPKKIFLRFLLKKCKVVVHANPQRLDYLYENGYLNKKENQFALRNYPNFEDIDVDYDETYHQFITWKSGRKCVYLQGLSEERRAAYESVAAVLKQGDLAAVVVGKMYQDSLERLKCDFGEEVLRDRILFVGKIAQLKIPQYVSECQLSLIFYKNVQPNNWYCEANRFYQSVIMGLPVVTGNNPSMKELVEKYEFGVSLDDDGSSIEKIVAGMNQVLSNYDYYRQNTLKYRSNLLWDNQEDVIKHVVETLMM